MNYSESLYVTIVGIFVKNDGKGEQIPFLLMCESFQFVRCIAFIPSKRNTTFSR